MNSIVHMAQRVARAALCLLLLKFFLFFFNNISHDVSTDVTI